MQRKGKTYMAATILFQGDSITDAERQRDNDIFLGHGYATLVSAYLGLESPLAYQFINRGIKNNTVIDLYKRRENDIFRIKPDIMSILIGVNDAAVHNSNSEREEGVNSRLYEEIYSQLISETLCLLPDIRIILLEPFLLPGSLSRIDSTEIYFSFRREVELRADITKCIAEKFKLPFVGLQKKFDDACKTAPPDYWLFDGVHPTAAGHGLIAGEWINGFRMLKGAIVR